MKRVRERQIGRGPALCGAALMCSLTPGLACGPRPAPAPHTAPSVRPGIEVLATDSAGILAGLRVGLITNHTGVDRNGTPSARLLLNAGIEVVALLTPEHGLSGSAPPGDPVPDRIDEASGLPVYSLYGERLEPDSVTLRGVDALVFDIQDIGARYYTYVSTMARAMSAAARRELLFVVADRPNPIGGVLVQGRVLDPAFASFVGPYPVAMRHGMTVGELALLFNAQYAIGVDLRVIPAQGWRRAEWADQTGLPWIPTSPSMPDLESATHYPGICLFEGTNLSVGRGTDRPFQQIGAPWLEAEAITARLSSRELPGVRFEAVTFTPRGADDAKYDDQRVRGIRLRVTDRAVYDPTTTAIALLLEVRKSAGAEWAWRTESFDRLAGTDRVRLAIEAGAAPDEITGAWADDLKRFAAMRDSYLLYP